MVIDRDPHCMHGIDLSDITSCVEVNPRIVHHSARPAALQPKLKLRSDRKRPLLKNLRLV